MKNFFKKAFLALCIISIASCSDDDDTIFIPDSMTIADFVADNADYSSLLAALQRTGLDVALNGTGTFTVFAPNNAAFTEFLDGASLEDVPVATLEQVLRNHVLGTTETAADLTTGYVKNIATEANSGANISMYINTTSGVVINGESTVTTPDIMTDNGVIHAVDKVISLPTMLTFVGLDSNFSTLATVATTTTGFNTDFAAVLSGEDSDLTLLAPDNDAFTDLGDISGFSTADLEQVLLNHVIAGTNVSTALTTTYSNTLATYGDTMNNISIYINTDSGVSFNGISDVSEADIVASNGVIHKVDAVITLPTVVTFATADANFSTLVAALTTLTPSTDFASILSTALGTDPAPFTVFAPTDDAFAAITVPTDENEVAAILNYHVVGGANVRSTDLVDGPVTTLNGDVTIDASAPSVTGAGNTSASNIIVVDVQAANGVIHAIDQVLLPAAN
ncbi:fasciclin domain-containing protein [uncultured Aquimarina sp.]|uniref:fasciclin domain-containing protein n=1 Tax=uncultured Aquimarina sp. TaxID=575652 RepID=UPI002602995F|nr:fasciclin domain-containing protein [uncultured Aquimarina sp.]